MRIIKLKFDTNIEMLNGVVNMKLRNLITERVDQAKAQKDMMSQLKKFGLTQFGPMASKAIKNAYKTTGSSEETKTVSIKPSSLGLMGPMFKSINLGVTIIAQATGYQDDMDDFKVSKSFGDVVMLIKLRYDYQHPSGSNGYERAWKYMQGSWREW